ncbi:FAD-binding oxidoreductase [Paraburkholderia humisilvae]|nr:FAD-binding oxidoreductase [Paraburkholderia humisilvae]
MNSNLDAGTNSSASPWETLERIFRGRAWRNGQADYEQKRRDCCWNRRNFSRFPHYIVRAHSADDVVTAVNFAREHDLPISLRSGGHSFSGSFLRDSGILLDMSALRTLEVDPNRQRAIVGPGVTSLELSRALARYGLAFPTGHSGTVGLGGFLLGGGLGINFGDWGPMSAFQITALDLVTPDGRLLHASAEEHSDLFWAARGGGPCLFFAAVSFELNCPALPGTITARSLRLPLERLADALRAITESPPSRRLQVMLAIVPAEHADSSRSPHEVAITTLAFAEDAAAATALHTPAITLLRRWASAEPSEEQATGFDALHQHGDAVFSADRYAADNILTDRPEEAARILISHLARLPSPATLPLLIWRGTPTLPAAAYSAQGQWYFSTYARWSGAGDDNDNLSWLRELYDELKPIAAQCYINEFDLEHRSHEVSRCFSPSSWRRLQELKQRYDPQGVFQGLPLDG